MLEQKRAEESIKTLMNTQSRAYYRIRIMCLYWKLLKNPLKRQVDQPRLEHRLVLTRIHRRILCKIGK